MRLNEWGALLLHDLVMQAIDEMETLAVAECDTSVRWDCLLTCGEYTRACRV